MEILMKNTVVKHYKGNVYKIISIGKHTETGENEVVYQIIDPHNSMVYVTPLTIFMSRLSPEDKKQYGQEFRFVKF